VIGPLHISLHAAPDSAEAAPRGTAVTIEGRTYQPLAIGASELQVPFARSFEEAGQRLEQLERMFFEPDGSFVWTGVADDGRSWQVDGVLYDRAGRLLYVDLKGACPLDAWRKLLDALADPSERLVAQWTRQAVIVPVDELVGP
jgi:hypothetical protein